MLRCPVCRSRRTTFVSMVRHQKATGHDGPCNCGGYHYPHRAGSPCCEANPYVRTHVAERAGASAEELYDAKLEDAMHNQHKPSIQKEAPF